MFKEARRESGKSAELMFYFQMNSIQQPSPPQSPLSLSTQPLLTSTLIERNKQSMPSPPQSQFPDDMVNKCPSYVYSKVSSSSLSMSSTKSSVLSTRVKDSSTAVVAVKTEVGLYHTICFMIDRQIDRQMGVSKQH